MEVNRKVMEVNRKVKVFVLCTFSTIVLLIYMNNTEEDTYQPRPHYCKVDCRSGIPCEYTDEVDFRIIVMTYNRGYSVKNVLNSLLNLDTLNDRVSVEIWIDRSKDGEIDENTVKVALSFVNKFRAVTANGRACIHEQTNNSNIGGQWLFTWRPKEGTNELGLILEDDIIVSPLAYKWIKLLHTKYGHQYDIAGYTIQMENVKFFSKTYNKGKMRGPPHQQVFLYPVIGTWGYAPHPKAWRRFQDWYREMRPDLNVKTDKIQPIVPGIHPNDWYIDFLRQGLQETMWEMWHMKFAHEHKLFTMYSNLLMYTNKNKVLLGNNRREKGLHFGYGKIFHFATNNAHLLLRTWNKSFENLPAYQDLAHYNYDGSLCTENCCFNTTCLTGSD